MAFVAPDSVRTVASPGKHHFGWQVAKHTPRAPQTKSQTSLLLSQQIGLPALPWQKSWLSLHGGGLSPRTKLSSPACTAYASTQVSKSFGVIPSSRPTARSSAVRLAREVNVSLPIPRLRRCRTAVPAAFGPTAFRADRHLFRLVPIDANVPGAPPARLAPTCRSRSWTQSSMSNWLALTG